MKYYYFPSTFFNQGKGRRRGGALRGYGYLVAGTLKGGVADVQKVDPVALAAALPPPEQNVLANMEATAKPAELGDKRWSLWNLWDGIKTVAGDTWKGAKDVIGLTADTIGKLHWSPLEIIRAYNEIMNPQSSWERFGFKLLDSTPGIVGSVAKAFNPLSFVTGKGYNKRRKGGARFKKGSPEAKAYMARLRAMRRRR